MGELSLHQKFHNCPKNTDNRNKDKNCGISGPLKARSKHRLYLQKQMIKTLQILFSVKVNYN